MGSVKKALIYFGKCITSDMPPAVKVRVSHYKLDEALNMYFKEHQAFYAEDVKHECEPGDYVVIKGLSNPKSKKVPFEVHQIVYKFGYIVDPLTGKQCVRDEFIDDAKRTCEMFGTKLRFLDFDNSNMKKELQ